MHARVRSALDCGAHQGFCAYLTFTGDMLGHGGEAQLALVRLGPPPGRVEEERAAAEDDDSGRAELVSLAREEACRHAHPELIVRDPTPIDGGAADNEQPATVAFAFTLTCTDSREALALVVRDARVPLIAWDAHDALVVLVRQLNLEPPPPSTTVLSVQNHFALISQIRRRRRRSLSLPLVYQEMLRLNAVPPLRSSEESDRRGRIAWDKAHAHNRLGLPRDDPLRIQLAEDQLDQLIGVTRAHALARMIAATGANVGGGTSAPKVRVLPTEVAASAGADARQEVLDDPLGIRWIYRLQHEMRNLSPTKHVDRLGALRMRLRRHLIAVAWRKKHHATGPEALAMMRLSPSDIRMLSTTAKSVKGSSPPDVKYDETTGTCAFAHVEDETLN